jgi:hypothetical protein
MRGLHNQVEHISFNIYNCQSCVGITKMGRESIIEYVIHVILYIRHRCVAAVFLLPRRGGVVRIGGPMRNVVRVHALY